MTEAGVFVASGHFENRAKIHHPFVQPVGVSLQNGVGQVRARVDFAAQHGDIDLRT